MSQQHTNSDDGRRFKRLIAAPFTPLHADGSLHLEMIDRQAQLLADQNVGSIDILLSLRYAIFSDLSSANGRKGAA